MTEQFIIDDCGTLIDMETGNTYDVSEDLVILLNGLKKENKLLKLELTTAFAERDDFFRALQENAIHVEELRTINKNLHTELSQLIRKYRGDLKKIQELARANNKLKKEIEQILKQLKEVEKNDS